MKIWHHFHGHISGEMKNQIVTSLTSAGMALYPLGPDIPKGPGLLVFDDITQSLCNFLREITSNGLERVLAVSINQSCLNAAVWSLLQAGASDVLVWDDPTRRAKDVQQRFQRWALVDNVLCSPLVTENLIGRSTTWMKLLRQIVETARFTDASILITGETGTGKELVARLIHTLDPRPKENELILLDATTIVPALSGSEFFGHERGAFTGANVARDGAFSLADGGSLFLDEVGDLPLDLQAQLLRAVQEKSYKKVGGNTWHKTNFRLICATNKDLSREVREGRFRADLFYRLSASSFELPPLRERVDDVIPLAQHFVKLLSQGSCSTKLDPPVEDFLAKRRYPGNIRELRQLVGRMLYRHVGTGPLTVGDIPEEERPTAETIIPDWCGDLLEKAIHSAVHMRIGLKDIGRHAENIAVRLTLLAEDGNLQRAAKRLGVTDRTLQLRKATWRQNEGPVDFD